MTLREACNLVIQAAPIGKNQEILMFDMVILLKYMI